MTVELASGVSQVTGDVLFGGSPARLLRLTGAGVRALAELRGGVIRTQAAGLLARRLTDTGMAHPRPAALVSRTGPVASPGLVSGPGPDEPAPLPVTVMIPVRDRAAALARCLAAAGREYPVLVVDDGSADPGAVAAACAAHGARLIRRQVSGGPAAARNTALAAVTDGLVAFLDSDCVPPPGWIAALAGHLADPLVAAVAPRIVPTAASSRPAAAALDLGPDPARVAPLTKVAYVPTAALLARRAVLGDGFDEALRYGEDVDLVWRLIEAGWRVRYEPAVQVEHDEPASRAVQLARRFRYGTSAAPLTRRHPGAVAPLVLQPWPALTIAALLGRRPVLAGAAFGASAALLSRRLRASGLPAGGLARPLAGGVWQTWLGTGRWCGQFAWPAAVAVLVRPGGRRARTRWGRRAAAASLLAGPALADWAVSRDGDPLRHLVGTLADQAAYGAGVYAGCLRERLFTPLLPTVAWRPVPGLSRRSVDS
jgi:mycofactocin system glycosyltransferase